MARVIQSRLVSFTLAYPVRLSAIGHSITRFIMSDLTQEQFDARLAAIEDEEERNEWGIANHWRTLPSVFSVEAILRNKARR